MRSDGLSDTLIGDWGGRQTSIELSRWYRELSAPMVSRAPIRRVLDTSCLLDNIAMQLMQISDGLAMRDAGAIYSMPESSMSVSGSENRGLIRIIFSRELN